MKLIFSFLIVNAFPFGALRLAYISWKGMLLKKVKSWVTKNKLRTIFHQVRNFDVEGSGVEGRF